MTLRRQSPSLRTPGRQNWQSRYTHGHDLGRRWPVVQLKTFDCVTGEGQYKRFGQWRTSTFALTPTPDPTGRQPAKLEETFPEPLLRRVLGHRRVECRTERSHYRECRRELEGRRSSSRGSNHAQCPDRPLPQGFLATASPKNFDPEK
jgi:hypothetical protein